MISLRSLPYAIDKVKGKKSTIDDSGGAIVLPGFGKYADKFTKYHFEEANQSIGDIEKTEIKAVSGFETELKNLLKKYSSIWSDMVSHLGDVSLDIMYTFSTNYGNNSHRGSQLWHHDSVGRRLKLFMVAHTDTTPSLTIENKRGGSFFKPNMTISERKVYEPNMNTKEIIMVPEDAYLVDTDYIHRGKIGSPGEKRIALVVEFSSKWKRFCRGKVGKRLIP